MNFNQNASGWTPQTERLYKLIDDRIFKLLSYEVKNNGRDTSIAYYFECVDSEHRLPHYEYRACASEIWKEIDMVYQSELLLLEEMNFKYI